MLSIQAEFEILETSSTHQVVQLGFLLLELTQHVLGEIILVVYIGRKIILVVYIGGTNMHIIIYLLSDPERIISLILKSGHRLEGPPTP